MSPKLRYDRFAPYPPNPVFSRENNACTPLPWYTRSLTWHDNPAHERTSVPAAVVETTRRAAASPAATMSCAASVNCKLKHDTRALHASFHKCRSRQGYVHSVCGVPDPMGNSEMKRVCVVLHVVFRTGWGESSVSGTTLNTAREDGHSENSIKAYLSRCGICSFFVTLALKHRAPS